MDFANNYCEQEILICFFFVVIVMIIMTMMMIDHSHTHMQTRKWFLFFTKFFNRITRFITFSFPPGSLESTNCTEAFTNYKHWEHLVICKKNRRICMSVCVEMCSKYGNNVYSMRVSYAFTLFIQYEIYSHWLYANTNTKEDWFCAILFYSLDTLLILSFS